MEPARWGLIPHWKKDGSGPPLFNARAETIASKPSFRQAFAHSRCLIPMDGYYEWRTEGKSKTPYWITTGEMIWVAGLFSLFDDQLTATMVTTASTAPLDWVHHRMPRFLAPEEYHTWLQGSVAEAADLMHPAPADLIRQFKLLPADKAVGNVRNDYPGLIAP